MTSRKTTSSEPGDDPLRQDIADIKRLLIFDLLRSGAKQAQVAAALGVSQGTISKMFPKGTFDDGK